MMSQHSDDVTSPRIAALVSALTAGSVGAIDQFWDEVDCEGTPLVEILPDDPVHVLVTVLWRAAPGTIHVVFYSELLRGMWWNGWSDALLTPVPETDLFYRSYRVRADMRFVYWLAPNLPLHHIGQVADWEAYQAHWQLDPRNPRVFRQDLDRSYVELPAAPPQHWHQPRPDMVARSLTTQRWRSTSLGNERTVWISTPPGYQSDGEPYPLLLLFDGDVYTTHVPAPMILDNLVAAGRIPPTVAVLLDSPDRATELSCDDRLVAFLADELLP
jgi:hypothetical protein